MGNKTRRIKHTAQSSYPKANYLEADFKCNKPLCVFYHNCREYGCGTPHKKTSALGEDAILKYLEEHDKAWHGELVEALGLSKTMTAKHLFELEHAGKIESEYETSDNKMILMFRLSPTTVRNDSE